MVETAVAEPWDRTHREAAGTGYAMRERRRHAVYSTMVPDLTLHIGAK